MQCMISKSNVKFVVDVAWMVELLLFPFSFSSQLMFSYIFVIWLLRHDSPRLAFASCGHALFFVKFNLKII